MSHVVKTAISLPKEDFEQLEAVRKRTHTSRSRIVREALQTVWKLQEQEALEQRYAAGYQRHPELAGDLEVFYKAGLASFTKARW